MRILVTAITYLLSLVATAVIAFAVVLVLAGPHAGLLPSWLEVVVMGLGWLTILILPIWLTHKVWQRLGRNKIN